MHLRMHFWGNKKENSPYQFEPFVRGIHSDFQKYWKNPQPHDNRKKLPPLANDFQLEWNQTN